MFRKHNFHTSAENFASVTFALLAEFVIFSVKADELLVWLGGVTPLDFELRVLLLLIGVRKLFTGTFFFFFAGDSWKKDKTRYHVLITINAPKNHKMYDSIKINYDVCLSVKILSLHPGGFA